MRPEKTQARRKVDVQPPLNPAPGAFVPTGKDMENALVLLDTRYKIPGGSFLTPENITR